MAPRPVGRRRPSGFRVLGESSPIGTECLLLIALSVADLLLTHRLLAQGGGFYESNPLARWVFECWDVTGLIVYKFDLVGVIVVLGEVIERHRRGWGRAVVLFGCAAAALVYVQGLRLWLHHG